jgi:hypothetical protein
MVSANDPAVNALAREGGLARARALTPEERREAARKAANARWDRHKADGKQEVSASLVSHIDKEDTYFSHVEIDAYREIWAKVQNHKISATCPCDRCIDSVMTEMRRRYLGVLTKIDTGEKLDKGEAVLFQLFTGCKANRWTRVYRQACKEATR